MNKRFRIWVKHSKSWYNGKWDFNVNNSLDHGVEDGVVIQQFTGVLDIYGREICEGDFIKNSLFKDHPYTETVIYEDGAFKIKCDPTKKVIRSNLHLNKQLVNAFDFRVIGNILENPHLIK